MDIHMQINKMAKLTVVFGGALIVVGLAGYFLTGRQSVTALIPAFIGLPILALGGASIQTTKGTLFCLIAAILAVIGFGGCVPGLIKLVTLLSGGEVTRPAAVYAQSITAFLSLIYLATYIRYKITRNTIN
jgi:hypothetical protein